MDINRKTAYLILDDIEKDGAFSNLAINAREKECKPTSPAFVRELVYGVLRYKMQLDHIWGQLMDHKGRVKRGDKIFTIGNSGSVHRMHSVKSLDGLCSVGYCFRKPCNTRSGNRNLKAQGSQIPCLNSSDNCQYPCNTSDNCLRLRHRNGIVAHLYHSVSR